MKLSEEQKQNVHFVLEWVNRMTKQYGDTVFDKVNNENLDWGQALCRESYGESWATFMTQNHIEMPGSDEVQKAKEWEAGKIPDWVVYQDKPVEECKQYKLKRRL